MRRAISASAIDDDLLVATGDAFDVLLQDPAWNHDRAGDHSQGGFVRLAAVHDHGPGMILPDAHALAGGHFGDAGLRFANEVVVTLVRHSVSRLVRQRVAAVEKSA